MAERRPAGFNVDLGFYDSPEVLSIPRKIRAAAIGVWTLAGSYSSNQLTDGHVSDEKLRELGCTPGIRKALASTSPEPLWVESERGGIQFTRWTKWQRTRAEVKAYRDKDAERKRLARERHVSVTRASRETHVNGTCESDDGARRPTSSGDSEMSARTKRGVRAESRDPKTKTETEISTYVSGQEDLSSAGVAATPGADLVREIIPKGHPAATRTALRLQASELINTGTPADTVAAGLRLWVDKPSVGIGRTILASLCSEAIKAQAPTANGRPKTKLRNIVELTERVRAQEQASALNTTNRKELN